MRSALAQLQLSRVQGEEVCIGFDRGQISLDVESDFLVRVERRRRVRRKSGAPNKRRRLVHSTHKTEQQAVAGSLLASHKTRSRFSGRRESSGITKLTVLCPLLYHEIGLLKRYYESVLYRSSTSFTIPWNHESILLMIQVRRFPLRLDEI